MSPTPGRKATRVSAARRLARAQTAIRALTLRGHLTRAERLELAKWQREWVAAWRDSRQYVTAA